MDGMGEDLEGYHPRSLTVCPLKSDQTDPN